MACVLACAAFASSAGPADAYADDYVAAPAIPDEPAARIAEGAYRITSADASGVALECPGGSASKGLQMTTGKAGGAASQRFYVRDEGDGLVSLQSVASGLFLGQVGGKVVQLSDAERPNRRWKPVGTSRIAFLNAETGMALSLAGGQARRGAKAVAGEHDGSSAQRWSLAGVRLVSDGYYKVRSARGGYLGADKGSYASGAAMRVYPTALASAEVFKVTGSRKGWCRFESMRSFTALTARGTASSAKSVVQLKDRGIAKQLWKVGLDRSGSLVFRNKGTKRALGISSKPGKSGAVVRQGRFSGKSGQMWALVPSARYSLTGDAGLDRGIASMLAKYDTLRKAYDHIAFDFRYISGNEIRSGKYLPIAKSVSYAKQFIRNGGGNCYRFSAAMMWAARGLGYGSRVVTGWVPGIQEPRAPHGWCEVYKGGKTYVCDPDMYNAVRYRDWYMRTYANAPVDYMFW